MRIFLLILLFAVMTLLQADKLTDTAWNFSLKTPQGWKYQKSSELVVLGHNTIAGLILLYPHNMQNKSALKELMQQGLNEEDGYLQLKGRLKGFLKDGYRGNYVGMYQMQIVKAKAFGRVLSGGSGAVVIVMSTPNNYTKALENAGRSIIKSLKKDTFATSSISSKRSDIKQIFIGKWSYYSKYTESHVYLYPDGSYADSSSSSFGNSDASVGTTWGAASDSQSRGHWRVQGDAERGEIIFTLPNGETSVYPYRVHRENNHTYWSEYYFGERLYARSPLR